MLVWLNGSFGGGKSTTAKVMVERDARWRAFDPEWVGFMLRANLGDQSFDGDFRHIPAWRHLVPIVAREVAGHTGQDLVAVQTVLRQRYWDELQDGARAQGFHLFHVVLDAERDVLRNRIEAANDHVARQWRLDHVDTYMAARDWLVACADLVVDTTAMAAEDVASQVLAAVDPG